MRFLSGVMTRGNQTSHLVLRMETFALPFVFSVTIFIVWYAAEDVYHPPRRRFQNMLFLVMILSLGISKGIYETNSSQLIQESVLDTEVTGLRYQRHRLCIFFPALFLFLFLVLVSSLFFSFFNSIFFLLSIPMLGFLFFVIFLPYFNSYN